MPIARLPANPALNGTSAPAAVFNELNLPQLCRITHLLPIVPIGRSTIWLWVRQGRFPEPLNLDLASPFGGATTFSCGSGRRENDMSGNEKPPVSTPETKCIGMAE